MTPRGTHINSRSPARDQFGFTLGGSAVQSHELATDQFTVLELFQACGAPSSTTPFPPCPLVPCASQNCCSILFLRSTDRKEIQALDPTFKILSTGLLFCFWKREKKRQQKIQSAEFEYFVVSTAGVCEESTTVKSELTSVNPREKGSGCQEGGGELADSFTDKSARKRTNCVNDLFRVGTGTLSS